MKARVTTVMFNSEHPEELVNFWSTLLAVQAHPFNEHTEHIWLTPQEPNGFKLGFQRVSKKVYSSQETHIDIAVDDLDECQNLVLKLGGRHIKTTKLQNGFEWRVLEDPQSNPFCIYLEFHS